MSIETKEEVFQRVIRQERPLCPYCSQKMSLWEEPDLAMDDGLGWGSPYMFMCFNDACPLYVGGWDNIEKNYGRRASYRCICYPDSLKYECMPVWGPQGGHGQIIDDSVVGERARLDRMTEEGMALLTECRDRGDGATVLGILLDANRPAGVRAEAADLIGDVGGLESIEPLHSHRFANQVIARKVASAIQRIHDKNFTRECPFCAEIVKRRANVCKHCGRELVEEKSLACST